MVWSHFKNFLCFLFVSFLHGKNIDQSTEIELKRENDRNEIIKTQKEKWQECAYDRIAHLLNIQGHPMILS